MTPRGEKMTDSHRPRPAPTGWILIAVTITVVMLLGLAAWYSRFPDRFLLSAPSDFELVHGLTGQWAEQWPQIAGPPEEYREQAGAALARGELRSAAEWTQKALSLEPDHAEDLVRLVTLVGLGERSLTAEQATGIAEILVKLETPGEQRAVAAAWAGILAGDPGLGLVLESPLLEGRLAHLSAVALDHGDPLEAALDVLTLAPGQPLACTHAARGHVLSGQPAEALLVIADCEAAGVRAGMDRLAGDALDHIGRFAEAAARYDAAGTTTHAAVVRIQEGLPGAIDLEVGPPDAELHRLWWGLLTGDEARIRAGRAGIAESGVSGPEFDMALALAALWDGLPDAAAAQVEGLTSPESRAILARVRYLKGEPDALVLIGEAAEAEPNNLRLQLAAAKIAGEGLEAVLSIHPVQAALYAASRRRDAPWPAVLPTAWLTEGLDERDAALVRLVLGEGTGEGISDPLIDRWRHSPDPLWSWSGVPPVTQPASELVSLQGAGLSVSVSELRGLASRHPDAVGLQELLLRLQTPDANR